MANRPTDSRTRVLAVSAGDPAGKVTPAAVPEPTRPSKKSAVNKKSAVKKAAATSAAAQTAAKKASVKKASGPNPAPKTTASTSSPEADLPVKKAAVRSTSPSTPSDAASKGAAGPAEPANTSAAKTSSRKRLRVREDESPWTSEELAGVKDELDADVARLTNELTGIEHEIADLISDSGDGAGDDQADAGAKSFEREHEFSLADNSRQMLEQSEHALERIADGTYGICENCETPIGKLRLQAFPRATLCMQCKQKQERR